VGKQPEQERFLRKVAGDVFFVFFGRGWHPGSKTKQRLCCNSGVGTPHFPLNNGL
jgi:hypothetical protein